MEIRHLKSFKTIVELKGFNRAADHLGYAQSTITSHIKAIESELGSPVFERMGNKNVLTDTGKSFLPYAIEMLNLHSLSIEEIKYSGIPKGTLVVGSTESLAIHKLLPIINEFIDKYPMVDIKLKSEDGDNLRKYLQVGEVDIALLSENVENYPENLHVQKVSDDQMVFVTSINDTSPEKTILFTQKGCGYRAAFEKYLTKNNIPVKSTLEFRSVESIKESIKNGYGTSLLPLYSVRDELNNGKLKTIPWSTDGIAVKTLLSYHKNKWISPAMDSFINLIKLRL